MKIKQIAIKMQKKRTYLETKLEYAKDNDCAKTQL